MAWSRGRFKLGTVSVVSVKPVFVFGRGVACTLLVLIASASCLVTVNKDLIRRPSAFAARALDLRLDWTHPSPVLVLDCH
jgi:hypothetical protein